MKTARAKTLVLLAESERTYARKLINQLNQAGYLVDWEVDGVSAWQCLRTKHPSAAILDCILPGLSGMVMLKMMGETPRTKNIPAILVCARKTRRLELSGVKHGAASFHTRQQESAGKIVAEVTRILQTR